VSFLNPEYFWLLLILIPVFIKKDFRSLSFVSYGYMLTLFFIVAALSRPAIEQEPIKSEQILSDVVIGVDLSYSMQATDVKPTRLKKAKELLKELVASEQKSRFGVLGFTTNAIVLSPLTEDSELLVHLFESMDDKLIVTKGSSIMPALELSRKMSRSKNLSVVIFSDGGDEVDYEKEAQFARENNLIVNVYMLATKLGGTLNTKDGQFLKDKMGDIVVSRENEHLKLVSNSTGGVYTKYFDELLSALDEQRNREFKSTTTIVRNLELFYYFIVLAIVTFLVSVTTLKRYVISFLLFFGVSLDAYVFEYFYHENAKTAYESKDYKRAIENYKKIDNSVGYFNLANSYYKSGEYEKALLNYERVKSSNEKFKSQLFYNMANTFVRLKEFKKAREAYLKSLTLLYTKEAYENMIHILHVDEEMRMITGEQKTQKKSSIAKKESSSKKRKSGGSSNMKVSAKASSGAGDEGKRAKSDGMMNLNSSKAKLSSKQYELINKRGVNEKKPW